MTNDELNFRNRVLETTVAQQHTRIKQLSDANKRLDKIATNTLALALECAEQDEAKIKALEDTIRDLSAENANLRVRLAHASAARTVQSVYQNRRWT